MKRLSIILGIGIIVSLIATEFHSMLYLCSPKVAGRDIDLFVSPKYKMQLPVQWYMKMTFDDLFVIVLSFSAAAATYRYSYRIFLIFCCVFAYKVTDMILFWWDYKTSYTVYYMLVFAVILLILFLILPIEKKRSNYKSML